MLLQVFSDECDGMIAEPINNTVYICIFIRHRTDGAKRRPTPDMRIRHDGAKRRPMLIWITRHSRELKCNNWLRLYGNQLLWIRHNFKTIPLENALRAHVHEFCPTLNFICNIMEKHVKEDKRKEGRYNLVHLIKKVSEFYLKLFRWKFYPKTTKSHFKRKQMQQ